MTLSIPHTQHGTIASFIDWCPLARTAPLQIRFEFLRYDSKAVATALLGSTRAAATVTATIAAPFSERPTEGTLAINVEISAAAGRWHEVRQRGITIMNIDDLETVPSPPAEGKLVQTCSCYNISLPLCATERPNNAALFPPIWLTLGRPAGSRLRGACPHAGAADTRRPRR